MKQVIKEDQRLEAEKRVDGSRSNDTIRGVYEKEREDNTNVNIITTTSEMED